MTDRVLIDYKELRELVDGLAQSPEEGGQTGQEIVKSGKEVHQLECARKPTGLCQG